MKVIFKIFFSLKCKAKAYLQTLPSVHLFHHDLECQPHPNNNKGGQLEKKQLLPIMNKQQLRTY